MKGNSGAIIIFLIFLFSCSKEEIKETNLTGTWEGSLTLSNNSTCIGNFELVLSQSGTSLTGHIDLTQYSTTEKVPNVLQRVDLAGSFTGNRIVLMFNKDSHIITLNALVSGNTFSGSFIQTNGFIGCGSTSASDKNENGTWLGTKQ